MLAFVKFFMLCPGWFGNSCTHIIYGNRSIYSWPSPLFSMLTGFDSFNYMYVNLYVMKNLYCFEDNIKKRSNRQWKIINCACFRKKIISDSVGICVTSLEDFPWPTSKNLKISVTPLSCDVYVFCSQHRRLIMPRCYGWHLTLLIQTLYFFCFSRTS